MIPRQAFEHFIKFYLDKHNGRKLTLQPQLGWVDLNAEFYTTAKKSNTNNDTTNKDEINLDNTVSSSASNANIVNNGSLASSSTTQFIIKPRKHILNVSTYQMAVLMLFNNRQKLTYEDIRNETDIPPKDLIRALQSLAVGKSSQRVLLKNPKTKEIGKFFLIIFFTSRFSFNDYDYLEANHEFEVNDSFTSKFFRVKIHSGKEKEYHKLCLLIIIFSKKKYWQKVNLSPNDEKHDRKLMKIVNMKSRPLSYE